MRMKDKTLRNGRSRKKTLAVLLAAAALFGVGQGGLLTARAAESFGGYSIAVKRPQLYCGLKEHTHGKKCYKVESVLACGMEESEGHVHDAACYAPRMKLGCGMEESEGHTHGEECYTVQETLLCTLPEDENHTHGPECYGSEPVLTCPLTEQSAHHHSDACYVEDVLYICGLEDDLTHVHTEACVSPDSLILVCGKTESEPHHHSEACYKEEKVLTCTVPEHKHSADCYAAAPLVEDESDWVASVAAARLNGDWNHDLLEIAKTQLGYSPDGTNVSYGPDGQLRYYTRYGDWYTDGDLMYEDWCLMFVSFCIHYAGIDGLPYGCGCPDWLKMVDGSLYHPYGDGYAPKPGDIVLFTYGRKSFREENEKRAELKMEPLPTSGMYVIADHVGILVSMNNKAFRTIEGNNGPVGYHSYSFGTEEEPGAEEILLGYVSIPQNPHHRTVTDYTGQCSVTADLSVFVKPHLRAPTFSEYQLWGQSHDTASLLLGWGVCFVEGADGNTPYTPSGVLRYSFRFDSLPEAVCVTFLGENGPEEIPCTVNGNRVDFSTDRVGTFIFSRA